MDEYTNSGFDSSDQDTQSTNNEQIYPESMEIVTSNEFQGDQGEQASSGITSFFGSVMQKGSEAIEAMQNSYTLMLTSGRRDVPNFMGRTTLVKRSDGLLYFQSEKDVLYELLEVSWEGPQYQTRVVTDEVNSSKTKKGRKGRVAGAVIGSVLLPGAGTLIGAAVGTGSKSKTKGGSHSETFEEQVEVPAPLYMTLHNLMSGTTVAISADVTSDQGFDLLGLLNPYEEGISRGNNAIEPVEVATTALPGEMPVQINVVPTQASDPYEELKKAKELLDMGILTQEEFDKKKSELLGM